MTATIDVSVPSRGDWSFLLEVQRPQKGLDIPFPYPGEETGVSNRNQVLG